MRLLGSEWQWTDYEEIPSTNDEAINIRLITENQKIIITAKSQTKGRGRRGRNWVSEQGNLFFSQLFRTKIPLSDLGFLVSLSVAQTIISLDPQKNVKLKWPNDVLIAGKKVSGILIESKQNGDAVIGVGVNLVSSPKRQGIIYPTTSLLEEGISVSREIFLDNYLSFFEKNMKKHISFGFAKILSDWQKFAYALNQNLIVRQGENKKEGIFKGIDEKGFLLLEQKEGTLKISVGDVVSVSKG